MQQLTRRLNLPPSPLRAVPLGLGAGRRCSANFKDSMEGGLCEGASTCLQLSPICSSDSESSASEASSSVQSRRSASARPKLVNSSSASPPAAAEPLASSLPSHMAHPASCLLAPPPFSAPNEASVQQQPQPLASAGAAAAAPALAALYAIADPLSPTDSAAPAAPAPPAASPSTPPLCSAPHPMLGSSAFFVTGVAAQLPVDPYAVSRQSAPEAAAQPLFLSPSQGPSLAPSSQTANAAVAGSVECKGEASVRAGCFGRRMAAEDSGSSFPPWRAPSPCAAFQRQLNELRRETALLQERVFVWGELPTDPYQRRSATTLAPLPTSAAAAQLGNDGPSLQKQQLLLQPTLAFEKTSSSPRAAAPVPALFRPPPVLLPPPQRPALLELGKGNELLNSTQREALSAPGGAPQKETSRPRHLQVQLQVHLPPQRQLPPPPPPSVAVGRESFVCGSAASLGRVCEAEAQQLSRRRPKSSRQWKGSLQPPSAAQSRALVLMRRTCYRCRRKGHEASACPENGSPV